ncbi:conjugal transfer protein TrbL family protein [Mangrovihabitans endophyticus]|uniref:Uncharacterized protein n=1 Tax=Mangrovihabitans endophyticus TaxID=1751298 RepID=A0A8J3C8M3_9ACTN|nr:conjugal transfer protein TrbL family protein [Mangrovihabitans endophyticus]GGL20190.1 hypothetical protein GCM10012284_63520 [Mangrovihabitans endophyticus]
MVDWLMDGLLGWLAGQILEVFGDLLGLVTPQIFLSPDVTGLPQVTALAGRSTLVVDACFVLAIIAVGIAAMAGDSIELRYGLKQLTPRLVVGLVLSVFAVPLTGVLIRVANALTVAMTGRSAPTTHAVGYVRDRLASALTDNTDSFLMVVIGLLIVVLMVMLGVGWLTRIAVLLVLAGIAPAALACYATPWTKGAADLWVRTVLGCLATPALQAVAFSAGIGLLLDPGANLPAGGSGSETVNLLLVIVVLWTTVRIPALMRRYVLSRGGPTLLAVVWRTVAVQGMTRAVRRTPPPRVDASTHTHHHYRRLRNVYLNPE